MSKKLSFQKKLGLLGFEKEATFRHKMIEKLKLFSENVFLASGEYNTKVVIRVMVALNRARRP